MAGNPGSTESSLRPWLAIVMVTLSVVGIIVAAAVAIITADEAQRPEMTRLVFTSVLPLFGTWVGTVLAFYFAKDNLQAATESTVRLAGRVERVTPVASAMIPRAQMVFYQLAAEADPLKLTLSEIEQKMTGSGMSRIPILRADDSVAYIVNRSTLLKFAAQATMDAKSTIADLMELPDLAKEVQAIAVVGPTDVLGTARARMRDVEGCKDVFVTKGGQRNDAVIGWLTNTDLAKVE